MAAFGISGRETEQLGMSGCCSERINIKEREKEKGKREGVVLIKQKRKKIILQVDHGASLVYFFLCVRKKRAHDLISCMKEQLTRHGPCKGILDFAGLVLFV